MKAILALGLITAVLCSCGKNHTFPSKPQITFNSVYPQEAHNGSADSLLLSLGFKYGGATTLDSVFYSQDIRDGAYKGLQMPAYPSQDNQQGNILVVLRPGLDFQFPLSVVDTSYFYVYVTYGGGLSTDTIKAGPVLLYGN